MKKYLNKLNKGFTLVELIVTITILAILVGLLVPSVYKYMGESDSDICAASRDNFVARYYLLYNSQKKSIAYDTWKLEVEEQTCRCKEKYKVGQDDKGVYVECPVHGRTYANTKQLSTHLQVETNSTINPTTIMPVETTTKVLETTTPKPIVTIKPTETTTEKLTNNIYDKPISQEIKDRWDRPYQLIKKEVQSGQIKENNYTYNYTYCNVDNSDDYNGYLYYDKKTGDLYIVGYGDVTVFRNKCPLPDNIEDWSVSYYKEKQPDAQMYKIKNDTPILETDFYLKYGNKYWNEESVPSRGRQYNYKGKLYVYVGQGGDSFYNNNCDPTKKDNNWVGPLH